MDASRDRQKRGKTGMCQIARFTRARAILRVQYCTLVLSEEKRLHAISPKNVSTHSEIPWHPCSKRIFSLVFSHILSITSHHIHIQKHIHKHITPCDDSSRGKSRKKEAKRIIAIHVFFRHVVCRTLKEREKKKYPPRAHRPLWQRLVKGFKITRPSIDFSAPTFPNIVCVIVRLSVFLDVFGTRVLGFYFRVCGFLLFISFYFIPFSHPALVTLTWIGCWRWIDKLIGIEQLDCMFSQSIRAHREGPFVYLSFQMRSERFKRTQKYLKSYCISFPPFLYLHLETNVGTYESGCQRLTINVTASLHPPAKNMVGWKENQRQKKGRKEIPLRGIDWWMC